MDARECCMGNHPTELIAGFAMGTVDASRAYTLVATLATHEENFMLVRPLPAVHTRLELAALIQAELDKALPRIGYTPAVEVAEGGYCVARVRRMKAEGPCLSTLDWDLNVITVSR